MPLSSNPQSRARFYLETDADVPLKDRAVFFIRGISESDYQKHTALDSELMNANSDAEAYRLAYEMLSIGIVGWDNLKYPADHAQAGKPMPFDIKLLLTTGVLTGQELWSLVQRYPNAVRPVKADLHFLELPQPAAPAPSAPTANPASA